MRRLIRIYFMVALSIVGSAILLCSCEGEQQQEEISDEGIMTEHSEDLSLIVSENGRKSYHFTTPLLEGYALAKEPYQEFRKGIHIITYQNDSMTTVDATLTANYAIHYEKRDLWEAKGNVVIIKSDGKEVYTQQLFWDRRSKRIYSNIDTRIIEVDKSDWIAQNGFESDEDLKNWVFRQGDGRMNVDIALADSTATTTPPEPIVQENDKPQNNAENKTADAKDKSN